MGINKTLNVLKKVVMDKITDDKIEGAVLDVLGGDGLSGNPAVDWQDLPG